MTDNTPAYKSNNSVYYAIVNSSAKPSSKSKAPVVGWQKVSYPISQTRGTTSVNRDSVPPCPDTGKEWSSVFLPNVTDAQWVARIQENPQIQYVTDGTDIFPAE